MGGAKIVTGDGNRRFPGEDRLCPVCGEDLVQVDCVICRSCGRGYHSACWLHGEGCASEDCDCTEAEYVEDPSAAGGFPTGGNEALALVLRAQEALKRGVKPVPAAGETAGSGRKAGERDDEFTVELNLRSLLKPAAFVLVLLLCDLVVIVAGAGAPSGLTGTYFPGKRVFGLLLSRLRRHTPTDVSQLPGRGRTGGTDEAPPVEGSTDKAGTAGKVAGEGGGSSSFPPPFVPLLDENVTPPQVIARGKVTPEILYDAYDIYSLALDGRGRLWAGTSMALLRLDGHGFKVYTRRDLPGHLDCFRTVVSDRSGNLWISSGLVDKRLLRYSHGNGEFTEVSVPLPGGLAGSDAELVPVREGLFILSSNMNGEVVFLPVDGKGVVSPARLLDAGELKGRLQSVQADGDGIVLVVGGKVARLSTDGSVRLMAGPSKRRTAWIPGAERTDTAVAASLAAMHGFRLYLGPGATVTGKELALLSSAITDSAFTEAPWGAVAAVIAPGLVLSIYCDGERIACSAPASGMDDLTFSVDLPRPRTPVRNVDWSKKWSWNSPDILQCVLFDGNSDTLWMGTTRGLVRKVRGKPAELVKTPASYPGLPAPRRPLLFKRMGVDSSGTPCLVGDIFAGRLEPNGFSAVPVEFSGGEDLLFFSPVDNAPLIPCWTVSLLEAVIPGLPVSLEKGSPSYVSTPARSMVLGKWSTLLPSVYDGNVGNCFMGKVAVSRTGDIWICTEGVVFRLRKPVPKGPGTSVSSCTAPFEKVSCPVAILSSPPVFGFDRRGRLWISCPLRKTYAFIPGDTALKPVMRLDFEASAMCAPCAGAVYFARGTDVLRLADEPSAAAGQVSGSGDVPGTARLKRVYNGGLGLVASAPGRDAVWGYRSLLSFGKDGGLRNRSRLLIRLGPTTAESYELTGVPSKFRPGSMACDRDERVYLMNKALWRLRFRSGKQ